MIILQIDSDFEKMFPGKTNNLFQFWPEIHVKFPTYIKSSLKYVPAKNLFEKFYLDTNITIDRDCVMALLLPSLIKTNFKISSWRPSIEEVTESFVMHVEVCRS